MNKCTLDIRKDIIDTAGEKLTDYGATVQGDVGFFPNPNKSSSAIDKVNRYFAELVVKEGEKGSFFIDPPNSLVDIYYNEYLKTLTENSVPVEVLSSNDLEIIREEQQQQLPVKPGVAELFQENPELAALGTPEQYSQYLDTIFPESKVKDIVYHDGGKGKIRTEGFRKEFIGISDGGVLGDGFYFYTDRDKKYDDSRSHTESVILNVKNISTRKEIIDRTSFKNQSGLGIYEKALSELSGIPHDSKVKGTHGKYIGNYSTQLSAIGVDAMIGDRRGTKEIAVFEPEQIHILGNKQDVQGFREFVSKEAPSEPMFQTVLEEAALLQEEERLRGGYTEEERGEFYQITSKELEDADKQLDTYLLDFVKPFGVTSTEVEQLKNRLGEDSLGMADVLNKVITLSKNRKIDTVPEEVGHIIVMLMGEKHPDIKDLMASIEKWSGYNEVYDEYFTKYYNEKQVKIEAIGKVIAKSLVTKFKENENDKSIFAKVRKAISTFFALLSTINPYNSNIYTYHLADKIATNVLLGNKEYVSNFKNFHSKLDYKKTIEDNPFGKYLIDVFTERFGLTLTGSLAIAGQGETIYRPESEPIHDLDFVVSDKTKMEEITKFVQDSYALPAHNGIRGDDYITIAYYIPKQGFTVEPVVVTDYGLIKEIAVKDINGNYVKPSAENVIGVDFFVYDQKPNEKTKSTFSSWQDVFLGKLVLSKRKGAERMFQREKDQKDYVLSAPSDRSRTLAQFDYLQTEGIPSSVASPEMVARAKELLKKMGVVIQDIVEYAKGSGLNLGGVNGVADLARRIVAVAEGKEDVAILEEMVHVASSIIEQKNPKLITELISKIDRFKIYKQVYEAYKDKYVLPNGKPDIRKIKKEAVDKLIVEVIVNNNENIEQYPELREEENQSFVRKIWNTILDWFRGMYKKSDISLFEEVGAAIISGEFEGDVTSVKDGGVFFQVTDIQKNIRDRIFNTKNYVNKVEIKESPDPILSDTEEASNGYEIELPDGKKEPILKRVTDRVKEWYKERFPGKTFTETEKKFNELKRKYGIQGHLDFQEIHNRYYNLDGTKKVKPDPRPKKFTNLSSEMYNELEKYYVDLIKTFPKDTLILSEVVIYDPIEKEAGTVDFLAIEPSGKTHILDWKFMYISSEKNDVAWFKQGAYNVQLGRYKQMLKEAYGIKEFGKTRAIPILMKFKPKNRFDISKGFELKGISVGSADPSNITDLRLMPISEVTESTEIEVLDELIVQLNAILEQIEKENVSEEEREFKIERLNVLRQTIRVIQASTNIEPLVESIEVMRKEGDRILNDYNTIYKDRPATSKDSEDKDLSDFSDDMNNYIMLSSIFANISRKVGTLVYNEEMQKEAKTKKQKQELEQRKELLDKLRYESEQIYNSEEAIRKVSRQFADKHIGERNLVVGLLKPNVVVKGLASIFRGIADLPLPSLNILNKLTRNAQGKAAADAKEEVDQLMSIREKLMKKGGDVKKYIQQIYQKDKEGEIMNKLIYKYSREFGNLVDKKHEEGGDRKWLMENIDVEAYKKEAKKLIDKRLKQIRKQSIPGTTKQVADRKKDMATEVLKQYDITRKDFTGWNNYIIKRHPVEKWYSEEFKTIQKDPDLIELYNFVVKINEKAKDLGYISNTVYKTFLPFVRKTMAEELSMTNILSAMGRLGDDLQMKADDVGYGNINKLNGEYENSIPKYYTYDFTYKNGVNDYSDVSQELFKNLILYIQQVNKYKYLTEVEGQLKLVKTIEKFKENHLVSGASSKLLTKEDGTLQYEKGNAENAKLYDDFMRVILYDQKYVLSDTDTPLEIGKAVNFIKTVLNKITGRELFKPDEATSPTSLIKVMDAANRGFQVKTLGLDLIPGLVNLFGGNMQMAAQAGLYFKYGEFTKNERKLISQEFVNDDEKKAFIELINVFMPLNEDPSYDKYKEAGLNKLTQYNFGDMLMVTMRYPEQLIEKTTFLTLLDNMMVDNGRIINIREFVKNKYKQRYGSSSEYRESKAKIEAEIEELKKTKSISATKKIVDGKLEIPGLDLKNRDELQRLTNLTRRLSNNALGNSSNGNINKMSMSIWTKSMMVFKGWIPKLTDTRFSELRKITDDFSVEIDENGISQGEKYEIGRLRLLGYVFMTNFREKSTGIMDIINVTEKGVAALDQLYEEFATMYKERTGETFTMTKEDFKDMVITNLQNQLRELGALVSLLAATISLGFVAPDDDDDKATKNFYRWSQKVMDKFLSEISFFYNPLEIEKILSGSMFPAIGLINDILKFLQHFWLQTTGLDFEPNTTFDEVRKKAQPIKYAAKALPVTKSVIVYAAMISEEFAKEFDITVQKESRR